MIDNHLWSMIIDYRDCSLQSSINVVEWGSPATDNQPLLHQRSCGVQRMSFLCILCMSCLCTLYHRVFELHFSFLELESTGTYKPVSLFACIFPSFSALNISRSPIHCRTQLMLREHTPPTLGIVAVYRNEGLNLYNWMTHHYWQVVTDCVGRSSLGSAST